MARAKPRRKQKTSASKTSTAVKRKRKRQPSKKNLPADPTGSAGSGVDGKPDQATRSARSKSSQGDAGKRKTLRSISEKKQRSRPSVDVKKSKAKTAKKRRPSRSAAAVRARRRRREERGIRDQLIAERAERRELDRERAREKKLGLPPDERRLAIGWLSQIRNVIAGVFPCSLDFTSPEAGARTPWIIVGKYEPQVPIGYQDLAQALVSVASDLGLETDINPQRLSQIRIVYSDPRARRGEGDSIVSKIGAWEYIIADLVSEIVGSGPDDEDSLAVRYQETSVPKFYVYFSSTIVDYVTASAWQRVGMR